MKKSTRLLLFIMVISTITCLNSCKKDKIDPCIESICSCEDTIYYTQAIVLDTFIMKEAEYIYPPDFIVDTFNAVHIDTFRHGNFRAIFAFIDFKLLLDEEDSVSFVYRGGVKGHIEEIPLVVADAPIWDCDPTNSVFIAKDTVYHYREHHIPYAVLEVFEGQKSYIDTAFFPFELSLYDEVDLDSFLSDISVEFARNGMATNAEKFEKYLKSYYNIGNSGYYFTGLFPSVMWGDELWDSQIIIFKNTWYE